ncbi:hemolysin family protein [Zavarzinia sp. CC-PAN008]|uniref:hemolysin family protein n=1 Tax=Zavarzinia sp. CC-PAN008 TaxID=3243332 RepID=UPI003F743394
MSEAGGSSGARDARRSWMNWLRALARGQRPDQSLRASLEGVVDDHPEGTEEEQALIRNILDFRELWVDDVMVPRADIEAVAHDATLPDLVRSFTETQHSRMPIFRGSLDDVLGVIHVKDLLPFWNDPSGFDLDRIKRPILFVPASLPVKDLLVRMQAEHVHMAIVVDEYGGTDGLVTIEDIVEEIVGDIEDEHDVEEQPMLAEAADGAIEAEGRTPIEALEAMIGQRLVSEAEEEEIDTIAGLVFALAQRVPALGEVIEHPSGVRFEIADADPRVIRRLRVWRPSLATPGSLPPAATA